MPHRSLASIAVVAAVAACNPFADEEERPLTHDLLDALVRQLGGEAIQGGRASKRAGTRRQPARKFQAFTTSILGFM